MACPLRALPLVRPHRSSQRNTVRVSACREAVHHWLCTRTMSVGSRRQRRLCGALTLERVRPWRVGQHYRDSTCAAHSCGLCPSLAASCNSLASCNLLLGMSLSIFGGNQRGRLRHRWYDADERNRGLPGGCASKATCINHPCKLRSSRMGVFRDSRSDNR